MYIEEMNKVSESIKIMTEDLKKALIEDNMEELQILSDKALKIKHRYSNNEFAGFIKYIVREKELGNDISQIQRVIIHNNCSFGDNREDIIVFMTNYNIEIPFDGDKYYWMMGRIGSDHCQYYIFDRPPIEETIIEAKQGRTPNSIRSKHIVKIDKIKPYRWDYSCEMLTQYDATIEMSRIHGVYP